MRPLRLAWEWIRKRWSGDDVLILTGSLIAAAGVWGFDWRVAEILFGLWLIYLGWPERRQG